MYDSHIVWGNGSGLYRKEKITQYSKKSMETVPELFKKGDDELIKLKTQQIYFVNDCIVFLMSTGEVFQKGAFSFQKQNQTGINSQDVTQIAISEKITKIKFGDNHLLFLSKDGNLYTMGDNYYGQLGIDNNMISRKNEPILIGLPNGSKFIEIHAYKNTSFAINSAYQLYIWGKSEFIPTHIGNIYAPTHFFPFLKVKYIKHDNNRIIIDSTAIDRIDLEEKLKRDQESEEGEEIEEEDATEEIIEEDKEIQIPKKKSSKLINAHFNKSRRKTVISNMSLISNNTFKMLSEEEKERNRENQIRILLKNLKLFNEKYDQLMSCFLNDDDKQIDIIKDIVSNQTKTSLKEKAPISLIKFEEVIEKLFINWTIPQPKKEEDFLSSLFLMLMTQKHVNGKENKYEGFLKQLNFQADKYSKDYATFLTKDQVAVFSQKHTINKDERYEKAILKEFYGLMPYMLRYKKIEALIYRLAMHQCILHSYEMNNVRNALEDEMKNSNHSIGKIKIIIEKFRFIESLLTLFNNHFIEIDVLYNSLPQRLHIENPVGNLALQSEKYIYKTLIQSTIYISDLWVKLIDKIRSETVRREKQKQITKSIGRFKDVYCTQVFLEKLNFPFPFQKELNQSIKKNIVESIAQIDGCVYRIQKLIDEMTSSENPEELENKKLFLMYASSVLETGRLQRMIWFILYEQIKAGII